MADQLSRHSPFTVIMAAAAHDLGLPGNWQMRMWTTGDEDLPSCFPVTDLAVGSIGCAGLALANLLQAAGHTPGAIVVDRRLASAWFCYSLPPLGWSLPDAWGAISGDYSMLAAFQEP